MLALADADLANLLHGIDLDRHRVDRVDLRGAERLKTKRGVRDVDHRRRMQQERDGFAALFEGTMNRTLQVLEEELAVGHDDQRTNAKARSRGG